MQILFPNYLSARLIFFASIEKTRHHNWEYRDENYCKLVGVLLVSGFDQETQRTQFAAH